MMKKIVCFGGGNAMPKAVLAGLRKQPVEIFTVASMLESGGSSAQLRIDFNVLPAGDIRRHMIALSDAPDWKKKLFSLRIGREVFDGGHKGHAFGNVFISGLEHIFKDFEQAMKICHEFLDVKGLVLPATIEKGHIYSIYENGEVWFGEDEIDVPLKHNPNLKIKDVLLTNKVNAYPQTLDAIKQADLVVIGPGDMYSSLMPCFLPEGMKEAMQNAKAKKVFICPPMTKLGETNDFTVQGFASETEKYIGCPLDHVLFNTNIPPEERVSEYKKAEPSVHKIVDFNEGLDKNKFIGADLLAADGDGIVYNPDKVVGVLMGLLE